MKGKAYTKKTSISFSNLAGYLVGLPNPPLSGMGQNV